MTQTLPTQIAGITNSSIGDVLVRHAYNNVWSAPEHDSQTILRLARITPDGGSLFIADVHWKQVKLPDGDNRYHVYQVGQIHPAILGLSTNSFLGWMRVSDICDDKKVLVDLYTSKGVQAQRHTCYYRVTNDKTLLLAVQVIDSPMIDINLDGQALYMRIYRNSLHSGKESLCAGGFFANDDAKTIEHQNRVNGLISTFPGGKLTCIVNGMYVEALNTLTVPVGSYVDWVFDTTVHRHIDYKLTDLTEFNSAMDKVKKYLLSHNENVNSVEYHDDIDIFVIKKTPSGGTGLLVHKNNPNCIRMVTHRDYSLDKEVLKAISSHGSLAGAGLYVRLQFHRTRATRPLVFENSRIHELYKLPYAQRIEAMSDTNSIMPLWRASSLESSDYTRLMSARSGQITREMVQRAYGYNALSRLLGATPTKTYLKSGQLVADVPYGLQTTCTGYEFDKDGLLVNVGYNGNDNIYLCGNKGTVWVEFVYGEGSKTLDIALNQKDGHYDMRHNYRFYSCTKKADGKPSGNWGDYTERSQIDAVHGKWSWDNGVNAYTAVMSNRKHLYAKHRHVIRDGIIVVDLKHVVAAREEYLPFQMGDYDVYLNGHPLVPLVDYVVNFPQITILNKEWVDPTTTVQTVEVRGVGFCNIDMQPRTIEDVGFMAGGVMSNNHRHDLRDDRVLSIICAGAMYDRSEVQFAEGSNGVYVEDSREGYPYAIRDIVVPMNNYLVGNVGPMDKTQMMRDLASAIDSRVSAYMTAVYPRVVVNPLVREKTYRVYSPFLSKIIHDLGVKYLWDPVFESGEITDQDVTDLCQYYTPLLNGDWIGIDDSDFHDYLIVDACLNNSVTKITHTQRVFLDMVVAKYALVHVNLDPFIEVVN